MVEFASFQSPAMMLRPAPFWAINDKISPGECARQLREMLEVGLSGAFFHSRSGLITDYLGEEWFAAMQAALAEAKAGGGYLWLYDEDLWASGNAGGQVAGLKDEYRQTALKAEFVPAGQQPLPAGEDELRAAYILDGRQGAQIAGFRRIEPDQLAEHTDTERLICWRRYQEKIAWWGGESYSNLMHPEAMREFIRLTHEVYKEKLGEEFGKTIPGIFTDEPNLYLQNNCKNAIPRWDGLPAVYAVWHSRDLWDDLPYLYFDGPHCRKIRLLFHRTVLRQFCEAFSKQIYNWCDANGLKMTGHYFEESNFDYQIQATCGSIMVHYRYQHIPGIDHLCRQTDTALVSCKQVGSAARQLGRPVVLSEIFGVSRHTSSFEDFKWLGDFNLVLGPNFFCPHLSLYSLRGRRKRDYPPNWNYQQTYWRELKPLNDYFTRLAQVLTSGQAVPDVLILQPMDSATAGHRYGFAPLRTVLLNGQEITPSLMPPDLPEEDLSLARHYFKMLHRTLEAVLNAGYDCDLGDESYIEDLGAVQDGQFRIGEMRYPLVIVPPSQTWRPRTLELLERFVDQGGRLLLLGELPSELDCEDAREQWRTLAQRPGVQIVPCGTRQIQSALDKAASRTFSLRDAQGRPAAKTYLHHRKDGPQEFFFIVNSDHDHEQPYQFTLIDQPKADLAVWDPLNGTSLRVHTETRDQHTCYAFTLPPCGSILLATGPAVIANEAAPAPQPADQAQRVLLLPGTWQFERSEANVLVLDRVSASTDGGRTWQPEDLEFRVRRRLAEHFATTPALEWQPWVAIRKGDFNDKGGTVLLRYTFSSVVEQPADISLVLENLTEGRLWVNGQAVALDKVSWHWDLAFGKVNISPFVRWGLNVVEFEFRYNFLSEVESAYLVGDFGVRLADPYRGEIIEEPRQLTNGSWIEQGYPFYSGKMIYRTSFVAPAGQRVWLRLKNPSGVLYNIDLNGQPAGRLLWRPWELELTSMVQPGENLLRIEVVSSRQNSLGPLHEREGDDLQWCGPNAFEDEASVREELSLFDYGLLGGAEIVIAS